MATSQMLTRECGLADDRVASFHEQGFLHLRGIIAPDELASLRQASLGLMQAASGHRLANADYSYHYDEVAERHVLHRVDQLLLKDAAFQRLWAHPRLLAIGESLLGRDVLPVAMALVMKTPGFGVAVPWHRDPANCSHTWGINAGIYLDDADAENGMLSVIPGSHRRSGGDLAAAVARHGFALPDAIPVPVSAGDVVLHSENVLHGSPQVASKRQRRVIYFGFRCIAEQLAHRGLDGHWIRDQGRILLRTIALRQAASAGMEPPYCWRPSDPAYAASLTDAEYVELRIDGGNAPPPAHLVLPFEQ